MTAQNSHNSDTAAHEIGIKRIGLGLGLGVVSAVLLILAFQPYSIWPLAFFAYVPMLVSAHRILPRRLSGLAIAIGLGGWLAVFLVSLFGMSKFTWLFLVIAFSIAVISVSATPKVRRFHERTGYRWFVLQGAVDAAGVEMIRSFIPPINTHAFWAQTMFTQPWMLQPISIFGVYGLTVILLTVNFALALGLIMFYDRWAGDPYRKIEQHVGIRWFVTAGIALILWIGLSLVTLAGAPDNPRTIRVAAVQHGFARAGHIDPGTQLERLQALVEQTQIAAKQGAQLVVWPELGLGFDPQVEHTSELQALAVETGAYILIGYGVVTPNDEWRNEAVMLSPDGKFLTVYGKNFPTTPGEPRTITAGAYPVYETELGNLATIICEDVNHPVTTRTLARNGAQLITVPTLETGAPGLGWEQRTQVVLRAVENRVAAVKVDVAGIAMVVDPYGNILENQTFSEGQPYALVADVPLGTGDTPYTWLGDWIGWITLVGVVVFNVVISRKKKS
jgi:apolipoprotein N-acyltransferase